MIVVQVVQQGSVLPTFLREVGTKLYCMAYT